MQAFDSIYDRMALLATVSTSAAVCLVLIYTVIQCFIYFKLLRLSGFRADRTILGDRSAIAFDIEMHRVAIATPLRRSCIMFDIGDIRDWRARDCKNEHYLRPRHCLLLLTKDLSKPQLTLFFWRHSQVTICDMLLDRLATVSSEKDLTSKTSTNDQQEEHKKQITARLRTKIYSLGIDYRNAEKSNKKAIFTDAMDLLIRDFEEITGERMKRGSQQLIRDALDAEFGKEACDWNGGYKIGSIEALVSERVGILTKSKQKPSSSR